MVVAVTIVAIGGAVVGGAVGTVGTVGTVVGTVAGAAVAIDATRVTRVAGAELHATRIATSIAGNVIVAQRQKKV